MTALRIVTWNINSVRLRLPLLKQLSAELAPDILCLQETKVRDELFPLSDIQQFGYEHVAFCGQKGYNGVAILSKVPFAERDTQDMIKNGDCRHISVRLEDGTALHNFYVPAGGDIPDVKVNPKFKDKLKFVDAMRDWSKASVKTKDKVIILGDFNIAPLEHDVWSHKQLLSVVSHTPIEVEKLNALKDSIGWVDSGRHFVPHEQKLYSWWSYRNQDWKKSDRGRRLDHIWVTPTLKDRLKQTHIHRDARDWTQPSDHVPVVMELHR